ncbi:MAG: chemotaxis protein CheW [Candidatus Alkanophagales archaeon]|nr:MAG: chemotaxis protein CheW [Candidatus Alkanophagales archaeon]
MVDSATQPTQPPPASVTERPQATKPAGERQLVVFKLGDEEFGVDIMQVREIIRKTEITRVPRAPDFVRGVINLRGQITTIINLRKKLGLPNKEGGDEHQERIIVVEMDGNVVGMEVDAVSEVIRLPESDIEGVPPMMKNVRTQYLKGIGKLPERLLILIDLKKVLNEDERSQLA